MGVLGGFANENFRSKIRGGNGYKHALAELAEMEHFSVATI